MLKKFYFCGRVRRPVSGAAAIALASLIALPAIAGNVELSGVESSDLHDQFIIKYRDGSPERTSPALMQKSLDTAAARSRSDKAPRIRHLRRLAVGPEVIRTDRKLDRVETEVLMRQLAADPNVEYVEVDRWMHATLAPNDPYYSAQWGFHDADAGIRANEAWDKGAGAGVVVAVLDTGITPHSDLDSNVIAGYDFVSHAVSARDGDGRDADPTDEGDWNAAGECWSWPEARNSTWHGTHVAGTIAALGNNSVGGTGTAFDAKILPVRVLAKCGGAMSDISDAITWASGGAVSGVPENVNPAEVINLSLGGAGSCSVTMQSAINGAVSRGTTLVVSAGNSNADVVGQSPANCDNVIVVASTTNTGERSSFSNYGALIDVAAPGSSILSTYNLGTTTPAGEGYAYFNGTSMAAPHVSGVVALMQSIANTPRTPAQVEATIKASTRPFPVVPEQGLGSGILDAKAAVDAAAGKLANGVTWTGVAGLPASEHWRTDKNQQFWTFDVPEGATNLWFTMADGSGQAEMQIKKVVQRPGSTVTFNTNILRNGWSYMAPNPAPEASTWHVMVRGITQFAGMRMRASYSVGDDRQTYRNDIHRPAVTDYSAVETAIPVGGRTGNAPSNAQVSVNIIHAAQGDLTVDLQAPDGRLYNLHKRTGGDADNLNATYTLDLSEHPLNGQWKLRVHDGVIGGVGHIEDWSVTF